MLKTVDFTDVHKLTTTYSGVGLNAASTGKAVTVVAPGVAGLGSDGDILLGGVTTFESDGYCAIQDAGYIKLEADTKLNVKTNVVVDGAGKVKAGTEKALPVVVDNTDWESDGRVVVLLR